MKQVIFLVIMCFSLTGLMAQKNPLNYVSTDGTFVKNGKKYKGENMQKEREQNPGSRSSGCPGCDPTWFIIPAQQGCPTCKEELVPGPAFKQFIDLKALDTTQWSILEYSVFKLTFCQNNQMELVVENGVPSADGIVWGKEGSNIRSKEFTLEPDQFYLFEVIIKSKDPDCPSWVRHQVKESFYVGLGCESETGGNIVNVFSQRNTVVVNQKGEQFTVTKKDTATLTLNQQVTNYTLEYNDTLSVNVTPDTITDPNSVATTSLEVCEELGELITVTSLQDLSNLGIEVTVSPNPTADRVRLNMNQETHDQFEKIDLYSSSGQFVLSSSETEITISELPTGMYQAVLFFKKGLTVKVNRAILKVDWPLKE